MSKPKILAFDTSSHALVVSWDNGKRIQQRRLAGLVYHSEKIFVTLLKLLGDSRKKPQVDLIAVGLGPGSFTGIRVGVTAAKTLAYALKARLTGISSLDIIAANCEPSERPICVVQDARRGHVYTAVYHDGKVIRKPELVPFGTFLFELDENSLYVGDGLERFAPTLLKRFGKNSCVRDKRKWYPQAAPLKALAEKRWKEKKFHKVMSLVPQYLYKDTCNITETKR